MADLVAAAAADVWNWADFGVQASAALLGAGIAALVSFLIVREERNARLANEKQHALERTQAEDVRLRAARGEAIGELLGILQLRLENGGPFLPDRTVDRALLRLLFEGTEEGYDVYRWTRHKLQVATRRQENPNLIPDVMALSAAYDLVRVMLVSWIQPDDTAGTITSMRRELARADEAEGSGS